MRKIFGLTLILLLFSSIAAWISLSRIGPSIKSNIETQGALATLTPVLIGSFTFSPITGAGAMDGLTVGNPAGFSSPYAVTVDRIAMQVESSSLLGGGPVMIESVTVIAPRITYEADDPTAVSNLESMKNNAKAHAASSSGMQAASAMRKVVIRNLTVMGGALSLAIPVVDSTLTVPLPPVHLSNIGADTDGATPPEIVRVICEAVADAAKKAVAAAIAKKVDAAVDKLGKIVKRLAKGPPGLLPDPPSLYLPPLDHLRPLPAFPP